MSKNNNIKCDVTACDYNYNTDNCCTLDSIKVSCECELNSDTANKNATICDSFKCDCGCKDKKSN